MLPSLLRREASFLLIRRFSYRLTAAVCAPRGPHLQRPGGRS